MLADQPASAVPVARSRLLAALPHADLARLRPRLEAVKLPLRQVLHEPGKTIEAVYFPETGSAHFPGRRHMLQGKRVLIVEDEAVALMLMEDGLTDAGAEVVGPAYSVEEALGLIEGAAADGGLSAAVLDIKLDDEMVSSVADHLAALGVPFLFATGYPEGCHRGRHAAAPTLAKPFESDDLVKAVRDLATAR
jgi:CheY-like chemotaxis protein